MLSTEVGYGTMLFGTEADYGAIMLFGTEVGYGAIPMIGTEVGYGATRKGTRVLAVDQVRSYLHLPTQPYTMPGTDVAVCSYAVSGTDIGRMVLCDVGH
eukprot:895530-Rhodomonas_salina.2